MDGFTLPELVLQTSRGCFVDVSSKIQVASTAVGPQCISPTAKQHNNDVFAPHSAPLALTATITMDLQRQLLSISVWVDSGL